MICGHDGRLANKYNLLSAHSRFFLTQDEAENIIDNMVITIKQEWQTCLRHAGVRNKDYMEVEQAFLYEGFFISKS